MFQETSQKWIFFLRAFPAVPFFIIGVASLIIVNFKIEAAVFNGLLGICSIIWAILWIMYLLNKQCVILGSIYAIFGACFYSAAWVIFLTRTEQSKYEDILIAQLVMHSVIILIYTIRTLHRMRKSRT